MKRLLASLFIIAICSCVCSWAQRYDFDCPLGQEWVWLQPPVATHYWQHDGCLRLTGSIHDLKTNDHPTFVGLRQAATAVTFETKISFYDFYDGDEAGLCVYLSPDSYAQACLHNSGGRYYACLCQNLKSGCATLQTTRVEAGVPIWLRVSSDGSTYVFSFSTDGQDYQELGHVDCRHLEAPMDGEKPCGLLGLYAYNGNLRYQAGQSFAEFDYADYSEVQP